MNQKPGAEGYLGSKRMRNESLKTNCRATRPLLPCLDFECSHNARPASTAVAQVNRYA